MHELPCLKPNWLDDIRLFLMKNTNKLLYIKRLNIFPQLEIMKQVGSFLKLAYSLFYGLEPHLHFSIYYETDARFENYL